MKGAVDQSIAEFVISDGLNKAPGMQGNQGVCVADCIGVDAVVK